MCDTDPCLHAGGVHGVSLMLKSLPGTAASVSVRLSLSVASSVALACCSTVSSFSVLAADLELSELVVTASRSEQDSSLASAPIVVISRTEIINSGAGNVTDLLRGRGGMVVTDQFGDGSRSTIGMRGFSETAHSNTLILVDGRRLNNADLGAASLNSIALQDVERIEILHGSAGVLYGDQAVGGVVNVITRRPHYGSQSSRIDLAASAGSYDSYGYRASFAHRDTSGLGIRLSSQQRRSDNYRDHNRSNVTNLQALIEQNHDSGRVFVELGKVMEELQTPGSLSLAQITANRQQVNPFTTTDFSNTDTSVFRLGADQDISDAWSFSGEVTQRDSDNPFVSFGGNSQQNRSLLSLNPRFVGEFELAQGSANLTAGLDYEKTRYRITSAFTNRNNEQRTTSLYAQGSYPLSESLAFSAGLRRASQSNNITDALTSPSGRTVDSTETAMEFGLSWRLNPQLRVFARVDQNYRFPKIDEQAYTSPGVILKNQTGVSWEGGLAWHSAQTRVDLSVYRLNLKDEIAFDPTATRPVGGGFAGANVNFDPTRHQGLILELQQSLTPALLLRASYTLTDATFRSGVNAGKRISYVPDHSARLALEFQATQAWNLGLESEFMGSRYKSGDNANARGKANARLIHNLHARYKHGRLSASLRLRNIGNKKYSDFETFNGFSESAFPAPEANGQFEIGYRFD